MVDSKHILSILQAARPALRKSYGFTSLAIFGSYSRNSAVAGKSDVDVMVEFEEPIGIRFIDVADQLEQILKQKVDLVSRKAIKLKYFKVIEPDLMLFQQNIISYIYFKLFIKNSRNQPVIY